MHRFITEIRHNKNDRSLSMTVTCTQCGCSLRSIVSRWMIESADHFSLPEIEVELAISLKQLLDRTRCRLKDVLKEETKEKSVDKQPPPGEELAKPAEPTEIAFLIDKIQRELEWHIDYDADENNPSPDDQVAHSNGLTWKLVQRLKDALKEETKEKA